MASTDHSQQSEATRFLAWADEKLFKMETAFNLTSAMLILFLMLLAVVQVVGRKFFNFPIPGYVDWVEFAMAIFCFLSIAYTQKLGGHVRMEFFIGRFSGRLLWTLEIETVDEQAQHEIDAGLAGEEQKVDIVGRGAKS